MSLSVIIPTFKNVEFLTELFNSIEKSEYDKEYEVLIGIDNCYDTLNYVYENQFPTNFKFYFFLKNKGPYLIKNTLTEISNYEKILFFDSDDIMMPKLMSEIESKLNTYTVIKPKYIDFVDKNNIRHFKKEHFGEGVFGILKHLFLEMNGFEGWRVAADSDFMGRLYKKNTKVLHTPSILFHRRIHDNSLTIHPETGFASRLRGQYSFKSRQKTYKDFSNKILEKSNYKIVEIDNKDLLKSHDENKKDEEISEFELKTIKHESISSIFNGIPKPTVITSKPKLIDYNKINKQTNGSISSQLSNAIKKAKLENLKKTFGRR